MQLINTLAELLRFNAGYLSKSLENIPDASYFVKPEKRGNPLIWLLGHVVVNRGEILEIIGGNPAIGTLADLFARGTKPGGLVVANGHDPNVAKVIRRVGAERQVVTFGLDEQSDYSARNVKRHHGLYHFDVFQDDDRLGATAIALPGRHNVLNGLAVVATAVCIGIEPPKVLDALKHFTGVERRLMLKGQFDGITVLDDYAHHPTEIRASLKAIRERYRPKRLWCVYQAHQYSRTRFFLDELANSFDRADKTIVPEIYFVRDAEQSRREVNAEILTDRMRAAGADAEHVPTFESICDRLEQELRAGDLLVTMGAGDVWKVADEYIQRLGRNR